VSPINRLFPFKAIVSAKLSRAPRASRLAIAGPAELPVVNIWVQRVSGHMDVDHIGFQGVSKIAARFTE